MKILVISDTHISDPNRDLPPGLEPEIEQCDCCFHTGDFVTYSLYCKLCERIKTYAVAGNMDDARLADELPRQRIVALSGLKFALTHGGGTPNSIYRYLHQQFRNDLDQINIFVFGHTHRPLNCSKEGKIYFNPGSVGDTITSADKTYGIIEIRGRQILRSIKKIG